MRRRDTLILAAVVLTAGTLAFRVGRTVALQQPTDATGRQVPWLGSVSPQTVQTEQRFEQQTRARMEEIRTQQGVLASMLPDDRFTGAQILAQVDEIALSYATLARSVGGHVAQLRSILPETQRQQVMQSCTNSLRGSIQRRYRWRGGTQDQASGSRGGRRGGWGPGAGQGDGYGRQYRGGRGESAPGLAGRLGLTPQQSAWIEQQDPDFEEQCTVLRNRLYEAHTSLVASLERAQSTDQELTAQVEAFIDARNALERRVAQHIVLLRPQLSQGQREQLCGLCRGNARAAGLSVSTGLSLLGDTMGGLLSSQVVADLL